MATSKKKRTGPSAATKAQNMANIRVRADMGVQRAVDLWEVPGITREKILHNLMSEFGVARRAADSWVTRALERIRGGVSPEMRNERFALHVQALMRIARAAFMDAQAIDKKQRAPLYNAATRAMAEANSMLGYKTQDNITNVAVSVSAKTGVVVVPAQADSTEAWINSGGEQAIPVEWAEGPDGFGPRLLDR